MGLLECVNIEQKQMLLSTKTTTDQERSCVRNAVCHVVPALNAVSYGNRVYTWLYGQMFNTGVYCVVNNEAVQRCFMPRHAS